MDEVIEKWYSGRVSLFLLHLLAGGLAGLLLAFGVGLGVLSFLRLIVAGVSFDESERSLFS